MTEESRADRLRQRRKSRDTADETAEQSERSKSSKPSKTRDSDAEGNVKTEQEGTYMYLPAWQKKELEHVYLSLKTEFEYEFDAKFEKNRHFYPLVVQAALEELSGEDAEDIADRLEQLR